MTSWVEKLRKSAKQNASAASLKTALEDAEVRRSELSEKLELLRSRRGQISLAQDLDRARYREEMRDAEDDLSDVEALIVGLNERKSRAEEDEAEALKQEGYELAAAKCRAAAEMFGVQYPDLLAKLHHLVTVVAEADVLVLAANERLPKGASRLPSVEAGARDLPGSARQLLSEARVERWVFMSTGNVILDEDTIKKINAGQGNSKGFIVPGHGAAGQGVEKRTFIERKYLPEVRVQRGPRLADLNVPGTTAREPGIVGVGHQWPSALQPLYAKIEARRATPKPIAPVVEYEPVFPGEVDRG